MNNFDLKYFRILSLIEGTSLLLLMFIAMPARRLMGDPAPVKVMGTIHGFLFLMFLYTLFTIVVDRKWGVKKGAIALIAGTIPFGSFWFDRKYLKDH